jgi:starch phosphorylase
MSIAKDPVCGMPLDPSNTQFTANFLSRQYYFDSEYCMSSFIEGAKIAYFSMEIGINSNVPTYSGGLGVLAGDVIRSSADLRIPLVAVTLVSKKGYLKQKITPDGWQIEYPEEWDPSMFMKLLPETATIKIAGRDVRIGVEIAISLIPPAAVVGIGLAFGRTDIAIQALTLLFINVVCLDVISSMPVLYFRGVRLEPLRIEKKIRDAAEKTVKDVVAEEDEIFTEVILRSDEKADVFVRLQTTGINNDVVPLLARRISEEIKKETGFSNSVKVMITPVSTYSS